MTDGTSSPDVFLVFWWPHKIFSGCRVRATVRAADPCSTGVSPLLLGNTLDLEHKTDTLVTSRHNGLSLLLTGRAGLGGREGSDTDAVHDTSVALVLRNEGSRADVPGLERAVRGARSDKVKVGGGVRGERGDGLLVMLAHAVQNKAVYSRRA